MPHNKTALEWATAVLASAATIATTFVVMCHPTVAAAAIMSVIFVIFGLLDDFVTARAEEKRRRDDLQ